MIYFFMRNNEILDAASDFDVVYALFVDMLNNIDPFDGVGHKTVTEHRIVMSTQCTLGQIADAIEKFAESKPLIAHALRDQFCSVKNVHGEQK